MADDRSSASTKPILAPLRLAIGWGPYPKKLGFLAILMLTILRLTIGWHFYSEGSSKLNSGSFDASRFLSAARGPFADHFHGMVWDWDGTLRLDQEATEERWEIYKNLVCDHYQFDDSQRKSADQILKRTIAQYRYVLDLNAGDIQEITLGRDRIAELEMLPERKEVTSLKGQRDTIEKEWRGKLNPILADIDKSWANLERDMNGIANAEQSSRGWYPVPLPGRQGTDHLAMNKLIPWFDCMIGACLLLGLFTPLAALAAAGFLFSVFLSQYPPTTGPTSTYYQLVESMACFVIASTGAGRFAGLDSIIHAALHKGSGNQKEG